jgi:photosystem II stability/assembly factor-like uncharacterized protein
MRLQGFSETDPVNVVCGSIQAVLASPTDPNLCFAGASNGGVWRTKSCTAARPNWQSLTDFEDSLSVGDMVFDLTDTTSNTILVGVGQRSSFGRLGGASIGMLYTTNALADEPTWTVLDNNNEFRDKEVSFTSVFARGSLMMAAAYTSSPNSCSYRGIYRSIDGGSTWTNVLQGTGRALAADPNDPERFYATVDYTGLCSDDLLPPNGVFTSTDGGENWTATTPQVPNGEEINPGALNNAKLSVSADGSRLWSSLLKNGVAFKISYSDDHGSSWTAMDTVLTPSSNGGVDGLNPREKPGSQGSIHFSLLADPIDKNNVWVGGKKEYFVHRLSRSQVVCRVPVVLTFDQSLLLY